MTSTTTSASEIIMAVRDKKDVEVNKLFSDFNAQFSEVEASELLQVIENRRLNGNPVCVDFIGLWGHALTRIRVPNIGPSPWLGSKPGVWDEETSDIDWSKSLWDAMKWVRPNIDQIEECFLLEDLAEYAVLKEGLDGNAIGVGTALAEIQNGEVGIVHISVYSASNTNIRLKDELRLENAVVLLEVMDKFYIYETIGEFQANVSIQKKGWFYSYGEVVRLYPTQD